jgi:hypothetical protein
LDLTATALGLGVASGLNAYGTVLLLSILGRAGAVDVPEELTRDPVLIVSAVMYAVEFVVDKIPYADSAWDTIHTLIRPAIGSLVGVEYSQETGGLEEVLVPGGAGAAALVSHGIKAGTRLAINSSPEPLTNIAASFTEDGIAAGLVALAVTHPLIALGAAAAVVVGGVTLLVFLATRIRRAWRRRRERHEQKRKS